MRRTRHGLAEERSIALHREVARRLRTDPPVLERARERVESWIQSGEPHAEYAARWREILAGSVEEIACFLEDQGEEARALRQVTPFAGVVPPAERWRIWRRVRERWEAA